MTFAIWFIFVAFCTPQSCLDSSFLVSLINVYCSRLIFVSFYPAAPKVFICLLQIFTAACPRMCAAHCATTVAELNRRDHGGQRILEGLSLFRYVTVCTGFWRYICTD